MHRIACRSLTWEEASAQLRWMLWLKRGVTLLLGVFLGMHVVAWLAVNLLMAGLTGVGAASMYLCRYLISDEMDLIRGEFMLDQHSVILPKLDPDDLD